MSLHGRYIIDRMKRSMIGKYFKLPVPPYGNPNYWEGVYRSLGPTDVFEWGDIYFHHLIKYSYEDYNRKTINNYVNSNNIDNPIAIFLQQQQQKQQQQQELTKSNDHISKQIERIDSTFYETFCMNPPRHYENNVEDTTDKDSRKSMYDESILMLGCGNSKFGEDFLEYYKSNTNNGNNKSNNKTNPTVIQVDVASRVIDSMNYRCSKFVQNGDMQCIQDDATILSSMNDATISCTLDKGLIDALYCVDQYQQSYDIVNYAVHRVLQPNGIFCILSLSQPEFILEKLLIHPDHSNYANNDDFDNNNNQSSSPVSVRHHKKQQKQIVTKIASRWSNIQIRKLNSIFLYRFVKAHPRKISDYNNMGSALRLQRLKR